MKKYVVKPGDTLYKISQKAGVRIPLLLASNPQIQNPGQLEPGQTMVIPELGKPAKGSVPETGKPVQDGKVSVASGQIKAKGKQMPPYFGFVWPHQVQPEDSWTGIAKKYGVTLEQLQHVNPHMAKSPTPVPGSLMYIPATAFPQPASQTGMPGNVMMPPTATGAYGPGMEETFGPNTHHPHRGVPTGVVPSGSLARPQGWYIDAADSASFLADLDETTDEGWSRTLSVRLGEDD